MEYELEKKMRERSPGLAATVARDQVTRANSGFSNKGFAELNLLPSIIYL